MNYLLGIDIGTSATKSVLFSEDGKAYASASYEYPLYQPNPGWAEQDPDDWWDAVCFTCRKIIADTGIDRGLIKGVGISGQMHGLVMLDEKDRLLGRSIIWCDQRTEKQAEYLEDKIGRDRLISITANPAITGFTAAKILWVMQNRPDLYKKAKKILLPKDYILYMLTGEFSADVSDGSGMQLMDVKKRVFSKELCDALEIDTSLLGYMHESADAAGKVTKKAASLTSLKEGTIVAAGGGDQACGAVGNGIVKEGIVSSTIGTSGVVFAHTDKLHIDKLGRIHTLCHAVPGCYHVMGVTQAAGLSLKWFRDNFCKEEIDAAAKKGIDPYVIMDKMAEEIAIGAGGLIFLPYLMGERSPHLDPFCSGVFFGITPTHGKAHFIRAILEGVVYSLKDSVCILREMGIDVSQVRVSGGGAKSPLWKTMQADIFESDIATVVNSEGSALGAAILGGVACGVYPSVTKACELVITTKNRQKFNKTDAIEYNKYYEIYKSLYPVLKDEYRNLRMLLQ
ncbi:MAG TPA: xylulokinase [Clostridia bacterium]|jgi:xylulokinase|nr:xylulokinase [Clostridiaceae bacterium]HOF26079.1 xylulokinase [Clostridia bacterium]HOM34632.1 xylulokinase [Clostridia bacterium]HOR89256.1 xylulokinase [Clostridia bacterium]HPL07358.1 xylulokinase [Clostridia bacterium]